MKIKSIHIQNFGRISNLDLDFSGGLNEICQENGWGKTTLSVFIRAMFFSFPNTRAVSKSERFHYKPWNGGTYGGSLTFSDGKKDYIIQRTFGDVGTGSKDTFCLLDAATGKVSKAYSKNIGQELFKINDTSFANTAFIGQQSNMCEAGSDISSKISSDPKALEDLRNFDDLMEKMDKRLRALNPDKASGKIKKLNDSITEIGNNIKRGPVIDESISLLENDLHDQRNALKAAESEKKDTEQLQRKYSLWNDRIAKLDQYDELEADYSAREQALQKAQAVFGDALPEEITLSEMISSSETLGAKLQALENYTLSDEEQAALTKYRQMFQSGAPDTSGLREKNNSLQELILKNARAELTPEDICTLREKEQVFCDYVPTDEEIASLVTGWNRRNEKVSELNSLKKERLNLEDRKQQLHNLHLQDIQGQLNNEDSAYHTKYIGKLGLQQSLNSSISDCKSRIRQNESQIRTYQNLAEQSQAAGTSKPILPALFIILGIIVAVLSFVIPSSARTPVMVGGLILLAAGIILLITTGSEHSQPKAGAMNFTEDIDRLRADIEYLKSKIGSCEKQQEALEEEIRQENIQHEERKAAIEKERDVPDENEIRNSDNITEIDRKKPALEAEVSDIEKNVRDFFARMHLTFDPTYVTDDLNDLKQDLRVYNNLVAKKKRLKDTAVSVSITKLEAEISDYLQNYMHKICTREHFSEAIETLDRMYEKYEVLNAKERDYQKAYEIYRNSCAALRDYLVSQNRTPGNDLHQDLLNLQIQLSCFKNAGQEFEAVQQKRKTFLRQNPGIEHFSRENIPAEISEVSSLEELNSKMAEINRKIQEISNLIRSYKDQIDEKSDIRAEITHKEEELASKKDELRAAEHEHWIIRETQKNLRGAKDTFSAKYMNPIRTSFNKYYAMIDPVPHESFEIDSDYKLRVNGGSELRETTVLSQGLASLANLCMRFALLDAMYDGEKPCVILDDPFAYFDDPKYERAMEFLKEVSADYQIFYFTCSEKRTAKQA